MRWPLEITDEFLDDRGKPATFRIGQAGGDADAQAWAEDPLVLELYRRALAMRSGNGTTPLSRRDVWMLLIWLGLILVAGFGSRAFWPALPTMWIIMPVFIALGVGLYTGMVKTTPPYSKHQRRTFLNSGFCAACGYGLEGTPPSDDAMVICPECSAAWKKDDVYTGVLALGGRTSLARPNFLREQFAVGPVLLDGRGRFVRLVNIWRIDSKTATDYLPSAAFERRQRAGKSARRSGIISRLLGAGFVALVSLNMVWFAPLSLAMFGLTAPPLVALGFRVCMTGVICFFYFAMGWRFLTGRSSIGSQTIVARILRCEICPCCGEDLASRPVERDSRVVCSRCRAAWPSGKPPTDITG